jgi:hypothetical protein
MADAVGLIYLRFGLMNLGADGAEDSSINEDRSDSDGDGSLIMTMPSVGGARKSSRRLVSA